MAQEITNKMKISISKGKFDEFCDLMREVLDRERIEEGEEESNEDGDDNNENKNKARRSEEEGSAQMTVKL